MLKKVFLLILDLVVINEQDSLPKSDQTDQD